MHIIFGLVHDLQARAFLASNSLRVLTIVVVSGLVLTQKALAGEVRFNEAFLPEGLRGLDLTPYEKGELLPGQYRVDVLVNGAPVGRQDIRIAAVDGSEPRICIDSALLERAGVDMEQLLATSRERLSQATGCPAIAELIDDASAHFISSEQTLELGIAQAALRRNARGYVSPQLWDRGVTAGQLGYSLNTNHNRTDTGNYDSAYLGLNAGLNLGDWRLRHDGSLSWQNSMGRNYQTLNTYAQRDITVWKSQLTVGDANTSGELFDTLSYRGAQLASDDRMLPESLRGYAPVIRGIARTNARVEVRQAGNLLLETTVAPGAFVIDDLYSMGYGGDLDVVVHEADGSQQRFLVPYASVNQLLRPGIARYSLTLGETRSQRVDNQSSLLQGTYQYGLNNTFTGYGGLQASNDYMSVLLGSAFATPIGAMAMDITHARTALEQGGVEGQSARLSYSKNIISTGSNFSVAAYRFSTDGYLDFTTAQQMLEVERRGFYSGYIDRPRSRLSLTADQSLGEWGRVAVSGYAQNYWNRPGSDVQYQLSYNRQLGRFSFGFNANRSRYGFGEMQNSLLFSMSMPLEFGASRLAQLSTQLSRDTHGNYSPQVGLSGVAGEEREYTYGVSASHDGAGHANSTSVSGQHTGAKAQVGASLTRGESYDSLSLSLSGSVVAHPQGVTLSPYRGETLAVISAPGAQGAGVTGYPGLRLDGRGNAVVPYLRPYEMNEVSIDPKGSSFDVELEATSQQIAPRAGAVVAMHYGTRKGQALLLNVRLSNGKLLPFGANVNDSTGNPVGVVGQNGRLYARVAEEMRQLTIRWSDRREQQCTVKLPSPEKVAPGTLRRLDAVCVSETQHSGKEASVVDRGEVE